MSRKNPKPEVIRALFALSGNRCAFPGCNQALISKKGTLIAQLCHIEAANPGGQRYNPAQSDEQRRSQANLLLLCYPHHRETDDVEEFTVESLQKMKQDHEQQFIGQYSLPESLVDKVLQNIETQLYQIAALSTDTNRVVHDTNIAVHQILQFVNTTRDVATSNGTNIYEAQLQFIRDLKRQGSYKTAINRLLDFKEQNWDSIGAELQYKVLVNLGTWHLDIHDWEKAGKYFCDLGNINYTSADGQSALCLGYAITMRFDEFDRCFAQEVKKFPNDINLWVAYIERHKDGKSAEQLLKEIPASVASSSPILFHIGSLLIDEGKKWEGVEYLKKAIPDKEAGKEKKADALALVGTHILMILGNSFKVVYGHFSDDEIDKVHQAKGLLTEAWELIEGTEMERYKSYIILNRGIANKILNRDNQAILDMQKAFDISKTFIAFKNLFHTHIKVKNLSMARELLDSYRNEIAQDSDELFDLRIFSAQLLCLENEAEKGIDLLVQEIDKGDPDKDYELIKTIAVTVLEHKSPEQALQWSDKLLSRFPQDITGYLIAARASTLLEQKDKALDLYIKAEAIITALTKESEIVEIAIGYNSLEQYEKSIPLLERLTNKNKLNTLSVNLIQAYYRSGDLQAALAIAENLLQQYSDEAYLIEIVSNIFEETRQIAKAIAVIEPFQNRAEGRIKDVFSFRLARLYSFNHDWEKTRHFAEQIRQPGCFSLEDSFILAALLIRSGAWQAGFDIAFDTRTRFFDEAEAHERYIGLYLQNERDVEILFPLIVGEDCAVFIKTENNEEKTFILTNKNNAGENRIRITEPFYQQLVGKKIDEVVVINRSYGLTDKFTIVNIVHVFTYACHESMKLFENKFADTASAHLLNDNTDKQGEKLDDLLRKMSADRQIFEDNIYARYKEGMATIGMLANKLERNIVRQWFTLIGSAHTSVISISKNEREFVRRALEGQRPIILDLTALLTMFFVNRGRNFFDLTTNRFIVSESTLDELQRYHDELERGSKEGIYAIDYRNGEKVWHEVSKELVQEHRTIVNKIIDWCRLRTQIAIPSKLIEIKRQQRQFMSEGLGECFYDCILLANEYQAVILSDDEHFRKLIGPTSNQPFSNFQLAHYLFEKKMITQEEVERFRFQLILASYTCVPLTWRQLWKCFADSDFQHKKPFTVAVKGLTVMKAEPVALSLARFFKELYLQGARTFSRDADVIFLLKEVSTRKDFNLVIRVLLSAIEIEFHLLQREKELLRGVIQAFLNGDGNMTEREI